MEMVGVARPLPRAPQDHSTPSVRPESPLRDPDARSKCASGTKPLCQATASADDQNPKVVSIGRAISAGPQDQTRRTDMIDRKKSAESRPFNPFELAAAAIVACAV